MGMRTDDAAGRWMNGTCVWAAVVGGGAWCTCTSVDGELLWRSWEMVACACACAWVEDGVDARIGECTVSLAAKLVSESDDGR
jgi:hypothetical protein